VKVEKVRMPGPKLTSVLVEILGILYFVQAQDLWGQVNQINSIPHVTRTAGHPEPQLRLPFGESGLTVINSGVDSRTWGFLSLYTLILGTLVSAEPIWCVPSRPASEIISHFPCRRWGELRCGKVRTRCWATASLSRLPALCQRAEPWLSTPRPSTISRNRVGAGWPARLFAKMPSRSRSRVGSRGSRSRLLLHNSHSLQCSQAIYFKTTVLLMNVSKLVKKWIIFFTNVSCTLYFPNILVTKDVLYHTIFCRKSYSLKDKKNLIFRINSKRFF